jgi:hypothetical protein
LPPSFSYQAYSLDQVSRSSGRMSYSRKADDPPVVVNSYSTGCYNCGDWSAAGTATASANTAAPYNAGVAAGVSYSIGEIIAAAPTGCAMPNVEGSTYYMCGNTWLQPAYGANGIYYRVVPAPEGLSWALQRADCGRPCFVSFLSISLLLSGLSSITPTLDIYDLDLMQSFLEDLTRFLSFKAAQCCVISRLSLVVLPVACLLTRLIESTANTLFGAKGFLHGAGGCGE